MRIIICPDYNAMSRQAANVIAAQVIMKPDCVLGLATGSTPEVPASILQLHPNVTLVGDEAALADLKETSFL